jgi:cytochrome c peroxidase
MAHKLLMGDPAESLNKGSTMRASNWMFGLLGVAAAACGLEEPDAADVGSIHNELHGAALNDAVREAAAEQGLTPHPVSNRYIADDAGVRETVRKRADLGRFLFFDHALSGVEQTSCGTCHSAAFNFGDGRNIARGVFCSMRPDLTQIDCEAAPAGGTGGNVTGPDRASPLNSRNTPSAINSALFPAQMWNGRFHFVDDHSTDVNELDPALGFQFPAPENVLFTRSLLTAQAHIPVTEAVEMTGDFPNFGMPFDPPEIRNEDIRTQLAERVSAIDAYRVLFEDAYAADNAITPGDPVINAGDPIPYLAIADAMANFEEQDLVMTDAPWDDFLAGDDDAMTTEAKKGALLFFGKGKCASCHSGNLFSDFQNHNIGVPQIGPGTGQADPSDPKYLGLNTWDFGLQEITGARGDRFKFRTPPLRGVAVTSPYMHAGQYTRLEDAILHHTDPKKYYKDYDLTQIEADMQVFGLKPWKPVFAGANPVVVGPGTGTHIKLKNKDVEELIAFLIALTDPRMEDTSALQPPTLPSALPADVAGPRRFPLYLGDED